MNRFRIFAWSAILLHALGLFAALFGVRPGTSLFPLDERMAHIAAPHHLWQLAWGVWLLAAISFIAFLSALKMRFNPPGTLANLALATGVAAVAVDLCCDTVQIVVVSTFAQGGSGTKGAFLASIHIASALGIVVANGLYSVAVALMTVALGSSVTKSVRVLAWLGLGTGLALSAVGFSSNPHLPEIFTGPAIGTYILWVFMLDRTVK